MYLNGNLHYRGVSAFFDKIIVIQNMSGLNNFWILIAGFLVFLMQPGFAALEAGFVQAKNVISISIKNIIDFLVVFLLFGTIGYGLMFGETVGGIFGSNQFFFSDLHYSLNDMLRDVLPETHLFFQILFAATAVTIVSGALAERTRLITYVLFASLMALFIYPIFGHWSWGDRIFTNQTGWLAGLGFMDFAGATVVHSIGGWAALAGALVVGPRLNKYSPDGDVRILGKENIPYAVLGMFLLWIGWLGFTGGSVSQTNENISLVILNTNFAAACGGLTALFFDYWKHKVFHGFKIIIGIIAGLVAVTASAGWINPAGAILIGGLAGVFVVICENWIEYKLKIDDPLSATAIHGCCGAMGSLLLPLFITDLHLSSSGMNRIYLFGVQFFGVMVAFFWSFGLSFFFFKLLDRCTGLRVKEEDEVRGLDLGEYGDKASWLNFVEIAKMRNINEVLEESVVKAKAATEAERKRTDELLVETDERKRMEELLLRKTELINLMQKITITANEVSTVNEAMQICLDNICLYTGWPVGHVYLPESDARLFPSNIWHLESPKRFKIFREITEVTKFDIGIGLPGRVLKNGKPAWIKDVTKDQNFTRAKLAQDINVKAGFAFPVLEGKRVVAVLEFFSREAHDPDKYLLDAISILATQLGRVTERKRAEKERQKMHLKMVASSKLATLGEVSTGVAHEINQPLTYISCLIQNLKSGIKTHSIDEKKLEEKLKFASEQIERIVSITDHMRSFGRQYDVSMEKIDLKSIFEKTLMLLGERMRLRNIKLVCANDERLPMVWGNSGQMEQVFINLFRNGIESMAGEGILTIAVEVDEQMVSVIVKDTGPGIQAEDLGRLFNPFFTTKSGGTGLGLSITYGIIERHGGMISVVNQPDGGAVFTLSLPREEEQIAEVEL